MNLILVESLNEIILEWSLQVVQSSELASIHNIRLDTGRIFAHRECHYVLLREESAQAEGDAVEAQKHTRRESSAGNVITLVQESAEMFTVRLHDKPWKRSRTGFCN